MLEHASHRLDTVGQAVRRNVEGHQRHAVMEILTSISVPVENIAVHRITVIVFNLCLQLGKVSTELFQQIFSGKCLWPVTGPERPRGGEGAEVDPLLLSSADTGNQPRCKQNGMNMALELEHAKSISLLCVAG